MSKINDLKHLSYKIRKHAINMTSIGKSSHIASILSMADIIAVLYGSVMSFKADDPQWSERDRFILSKGHAGAGIYAVLAEVGFMPIEKLKTHYQDGSELSGHVSHMNIPGVEVSTGSLGQGMPIAAGMALAAKINKNQHNIYVLMGDGECNEGSTWEAALFAQHHKLDNLFVIIDRNKLQSIYSTEDTLSLEPFTEKWKSFGWNVINVDGHNHLDFLQACKSVIKGKPLCIVADTIKGKGVSFMENNILWHYRSPQGKEYISAIAELEKFYA